MKWQGRRGSKNIEDRRRASTSPAKAGGLGVVGLIAVFLISQFLGVDLTPLVNQGGGDPTVSTQAGAELSPQDKAAGQFVSVTLADTEAVWAEVFKTQLNRTYTPAKLVLFKGVTRSPCGNASGATGPFYCPADKKAYLDTDFFVIMDKQMGAKGDFAAAYVVAHEIAHHVQNELGTLPEANRARRTMNERDSNIVSVMIELQADCYAGIWARYAEQRFGSVDAGDLREAINAAKQIGDDTLQRSAGRTPNPHTFTHGTSEQRQRWFARGYQTAKVAQCDTFSASNL
jgi:predicted metalloprotease